MEEKELEVVNVGGLLNDTIIREIYNLYELAPEQKKQAINDIVQLYKLRIEENKAVDDFFNDEQRRNMEKETQEGRHTLELQMHRDKMKLEFERLEMERINMEKDIEVKESQAKTEKHKMWLEIGSRGLAIGAWVLMSYKVMKFEETGSIRSKAFTGTLPKLKFW